MNVNETRAEEARKAAQGLGNLLYEKQLAYGDAGGMNLAILSAWLEQYKVRRSEEGAALEEPAHLPALLAGPEPYFYLIPASLVVHLPRLTRCLDRMARIVSNPAGDRLGEDPWRDLAGDAVIGMIMPRALPGEIAELAAEPWTEAGFLALDPSFGLEQLTREEMAPEVAPEPTVYDVRPEADDAAGYDPIEEGERIG